MTLAEKYRKEHERDMEEINKRKLIDKDIVFKNAMKSDFESIEKLELVREGVTKIDKDNDILQRLRSMTILNLAHNLISEIDNFE